MIAVMQKHRQFLLKGVPLIFLVLILIIYIFGGRFVSTDDAYIKAANVAVSSNVPGQVIKIFVRDNQVVKQGEPLFSLDDRPYMHAVEEADARLIAAQLQVQGLKASYRQQFAIDQEAAHTYAYWQVELARQKKLSAAGISSKVLLHKTLKNYQVAKLQWAAARQKLENVLTALANQPNIPVEKHPTVQAAQATLDQAKLNLSYTLVVASIDGVVTKVEQLQPGDYVSAGAPVFALLSEHNIWVEANFKETDITYMRQGQEADISVDAYPNYKFKGKVVSFSPGTGSTFSLLPPENATGNWVKIVQRVPVRVSIQLPDKTPLLGSGLSATVSVDTGYHWLSSLRGNT